MIHDQVQICWLTPPNSIFSNLFLIEGKLLYNIVLVSANTSPWISHGYTHVRSLLNPSPTPILSTPPCCHGAPGWVPKSYRKFTLAISFTYGNVYTSMLLSAFVQPSRFPHPHVHKSVLYVCVPIAALKIGSTVQFFLIPYICVNRQYLFFSFWLVHSV